MKSTRFEYPPIQTKELAPPEEGEVDFIDNDPYIVDPSFRFKTDSVLHKVNWRNIERINLKALKTATFDDINTIFK